MEYTTKLNMKNKCQIRYVVNFDYINPCLDCILYMFNEPLKLVRVKLVLDSSKTSFM